MTVQTQTQEAIPFWNKGAALGWLLAPLGYCFAGFAVLRRTLYRVGVLKSHQLPVPVIIVGNITVGGTGKTPLAIYIAKLLKKQGYHPGIISRGYGGKASTWPQWVNVQSSARQVGDEAIVIFQQTGCPMVVGPNRIESAQQLLARESCNIIICDDGLQHYALQRTIEIAVVDGARRVGNGFCLPAGPLREPTQRLNEVDMVVINGGKSRDSEFTMQLTGSTAVNLKTQQCKSLVDFLGVECHALAGIGNPARFFTWLSTLGLKLIPHRFPDHHTFSEQDIHYSDNKPVLMTEKDAVKCVGFATERHWYVPVTANLPERFETHLLHLLNIKNQEEHHR